MGWKALRQRAKHAKGTHGRCHLLGKITKSLERRNQVAADRCAFHTTIRFPAPLCSLKYASLCAFHVSSISSTSHSSLRRENGGCVSPKAGFHCSNEQWNPVLMQGTVSVMHSMLHLHLPWIDVRYDCDGTRDLASSRPSFVGIWIYGPRSSSSARFGT